MIDIPFDHQGIEITIEPDGRLWVNGPEGCLLRAGAPVSPDKLVVIDNRKKISTMRHDAYVIFPMGGAAIVVWEDGDRREEHQIDSETAAGIGGWDTALCIARDDSRENGMREEIDYDNPPHQIADIVEGWEGYSACAVEVW